MLTRAKILKAAEEEFSAKGYDGARVDEIAAKAGGQKALVYYYFASKAELLDSLYRAYLDELLELRKSNPYSLSKSNLSEYIEWLLTALFEFAKQHFKILRIVLIEEMKDDPTKDRFVKQWKADWDTAIQNGKVNSSFPHPGLDLEIEAFFFQDMTMLTFLAFNEKWSKAMGRDPEESERLFLSRFYRVLYDQFKDRIRD